MYTLVGLSYGRENEYKRIILAILSFQAWYSGPKNSFRIVIFTDNSDYFEPYFNGINVEYVSLDNDKIVQMKGSLGFIHNVKIAVIKEAFAAYQHDSLLFLDSDIFFIADPISMLTKISSGNSVMHSREYALEERRYSVSEGNAPKLFLDLIDRQTFLTSHGEEKFYSSQFSWNSGVLGIPANLADSMADISKLTQVFFSSSSWHVSEQLAFSLILQTRTVVHASEKYIYHYWPNNKKVDIDIILHEKINDKFARLDCEKKYLLIKGLTSEMVLREYTMDAFNKGDIATAYKLSFLYLLKNKFNLKFVKDVLYNTKKYLYERHR